LKFNSSLSLYFTVGLILNREKIVIKKKYNITWKSWCYSILRVPLLLSSQINSVETNIKTKNAASITLWLERWFLSSNAKDIGTLYLIFALFSGLIGTAFSVLIRLELSGPGVQYIADNQLYNSIITAHAIVMIFFMVKKYFGLNLSFLFF
jgi:hypothetical protein